MADPESPRDETLRLVLSADQEQWIRDQLGMARGYAWASTFVLAVCLGWIAAYAIGLILHDEDPRCFTVSGDDPNYQETARDLRAQGLEPCPTRAEKARNSSLRTGLAFVMLAAALALLVAVLALGRNLYLIRHYRRHLTDHAAFLRKYNRT